MEKLFKNTNFTGASGMVYTVDTMISCGTGQGDIYSVHNERKERFALKLFHTGNKKRIEQQIDTLIRRGKACDAFVYPLDKVQIKGRVGYVMEYVGDNWQNAAILYNGIEDNGRYVDLAWHEKLILLAEIVGALDVINNAELGIMDVKFENIKVDLENMRVKILDTDTIVYGKDKSFVVGTVGFMPPATMTGREKPNKFNDVYSIAVLIFMSLLGVHPLDGKRRYQQCNENIESYLFGTHPVYLFHPTDTSNRPIPADGSGRNQQCVIDKMHRYPAYFRAAMNKTFVEGLFNGEQRTAMSEWTEILEKLYNDSFICENCGAEHFMDTQDKVCKVCGNALIKPVMMSSDRVVPLFNELKVFSDDLWNTTAHYEIFRVVTTKFDGRFGLENLTFETASLKLADESVKQFARGEVIPIFMDSEIQIENHTINFK